MCANYIDRKLFNIKILNTLFSFTLLIHACIHRKAEVEVDMNVCVYVWFSYRHSLLGHWLVCVCVCADYINLKQRLMLFSLPCSSTRAYIGKLT